MNQRLEVTLELVVNGYTFKLALPLGAAYDDALAAIQQFIQHVSVMKENAAQHAATVQPVQPTVTTDQTTESN